MSKTTIINSSVLSGFVELLPEKQMIFDKVVDIVTSVYKSSGYVNIDTPIIEKSEVLLAKAGGETEKQIYKIIKGDNDLALRFDLTIPFARYVANHFNDLKMPFKRFQIGKVYRGERAQKGRYREFYQADIDLVNPNNLSNMYEIDVISTIVNVLLSLSNIFFLGSFCVKISSRKIWDAVLNNFNFSYSKKEKLFSIIDKKNKMEEDVFYIELEKIIDNKEQFNLIKSMFSLNFSIDTGVVTKDLSVISEDLNFKNALLEIENILIILSKGFNNTNVRFELDLSIVRGLDYYTGIVFETVFDKYLNLGSVASGGRYDNLCSYYSNQNIHGIGGSIGISRLFIPLIEEGVITLPNSSLFDVLVVPQNKEYFEKAFLINNKIISSKLRSSVLYDVKKFKKLMEYANKIAVKFVVIIGEEEELQNKLSLKNMQTGEQKLYTEEEMILALSKELSY